MIYEKLLELKMEVEACRGKVVRITLDKEGNEALRSELSASVGSTKTLYGIVIDRAKECPTCGKTMNE